MLLYFCRDPGTFHLYFGRHLGTVSGTRPMTAHHPTLAKPLPPRRQPNGWWRRALIFVTMVALANALFGERGLVQTFRAEREYARAAAALSRLQRENAGLREEARRLGEDPSAIESVAREDLGLIRKGELVFRLR